MTSIGIVIPAKNESASIRNCLESLQPFQQAGDSLIVVDANSSDDTVNQVNQANAPFIRSRNPQRGFVITTGVHYLMQTIKPDVIVIAHADMRFHPNARNKLLQTLLNTPNCAGGCFGHRIQSKKFIFRLIEQGNTFRAQYLKMPYGDQAQFFCPKILQKAGGFPQQSRLEDVELSLRINASGQMLYLNTPVIISARHWQNGIIQNTINNWLTVLRYYKNRRKTHSETPKTT